MRPVFSSRINIYAGSPVDRAAHRREDAAWIEAALADPDTLFVPVWRGRSLIRTAGEGAPEAVYLSGAAATALRMADGRVPDPWAFLGLLDGVSLFACDLGPAEDPIPLLPPELGTFVDLRSLAQAALPPADASVLAHAKSLMHWRANFHFCTVCGAACEPRSAGHVMACTRCGTQHFPRTDSAVIMLVHRNDRVLLGHSPRFPIARMYSTLAGFVEPGESLEEAVRREVKEEAGILLGEVHYHSSQPWPFPSNIMLGFFAEALTEEITIDPTELLDARWFTREELRDPNQFGFRLPRGDSIAARLIEDWIAGA